jgi:hypothetical protein
LRGQQIVHFLHIGKTGGTAVKHALDGIHGSGGFLLEMHEHDVTLTHVPVGEKFMFFVRDPIKRFVSGFYSRRRQGRPRYSVPWTPAEQEAFTSFDTPNQLALDLSAEDPARRTKATRAMNGIVHVRSSYWTWFHDEAYLRSRLADLFFVGFQESLDRDFERLKRKLALPMGLALPTDEVKAHRNPKGLSTDLDDVAMNNLTEWYARDYQFIEICRELSARGGD